MGLVSGRPIARTVVRRRSGGVCLLFYFALWVSLPPVLDRISNRVDGADGNSILAEPSGDFSFRPKLVLGPVGVIVIGIDCDV